MWDEKQVYSLAGNLAFNFKQISTTMDSEQKKNKDLILREKLALQRTTLANQSTFLSFMRTAMYFLIAGLSLKNLIAVPNSFYIELGLFVSSLIIFVFGIINYFVHRKSIANNKKHVGDYQLEYLKL